MAQYGSDSETAIGRGTRRKKLAGLLKSANELRQSYQQSYGLGQQRDGNTDYDDSGMPGAFPDVSIARSGDEEMLLFPSYARRRTPRKTGHQDLPGSIQDMREHDRYSGAGYVHQEWDRYEDANSIVEVDVRGWVYSPQKGQLSRYNRAMIALARRMSGIPAPSSSRASSPNSAHHARVEARAANHEQEVVDKEAEAITRKGEGEQQVAWQGGYSETPSRKEHGESSQSSLKSQVSSSRHTEGFSNGRAPNPLGKTSAYTDQDDAPGSESLAKRASWNHPADMSSAELSVANAHMMLRLRPFLTTPLTSTPLTVFFYNSNTSRSRTIYTNEAGHFQLRAALDFIPTNVRILASENLSATEEIHVTEPHGVSLISDVDDTIKHSAIGAGAREVFRNVFIRDLGDLRIDGVKEWYSKMAGMGVKLHYVSNMPWQLFPVLSTFLSGAGLPKGSFHLKHYTGMLQGIFEPVAERKKGTLERIMSDFPQRRFILVGDSGEADLELYTDIVEANPGRVLGVFIRDVTTTASQGFFDPVMNGSTAKGFSRSSGATNFPDVSKMHFEDFQQRPKLPPRQQTRSSGTLNAPKSGPPMGKLIDYEDEPEPAKIKRSMTDNELSPSSRTSSQSNSTFPPCPPSKPPALRSSSQNDSTPSSTSQPDQPARKPAPSLPPKPRKLSSIISSQHSPNDASNPSRTPPQRISSSSTNFNPQDPNNPYSYRSAVRSKVSSVYNSLPSFYYPPPTSSSSTSIPPSQNHNHNGSSSIKPPLPSRPSSTIRPSLPSDNTTSPSTTSSSNPLSSYPAAAAHYATSHLSGGFSGYNHSSSQPQQSTQHKNLYNNSTANANANGNGYNGIQRSKKEELWLQRWARAKRILDSQGVVLRSWRVGGDVSGVAGGLVERALREEEEGGKSGGGGGG